MPSESYVRQLIGPIEACRLLTMDQHVRVPICYNYVEDGQFSFRLEALVLSGFKIMFFRSKFLSLSYLVAIVTVSTSVIKCFELGSLDAAIL